VTRTCHAISELKEAKRHSNYVFLHSIFDSQTNADEKQSFTREELEAAAKQGLIDKKVYALGGMNLDNVKEAKALGFGGIVICGDLWNRFNIHNEIDYKELLVHFEKLRKSIE
jgi:thiamine-phosphate pyrophosphorylase